MDMGDG
jgi:hypothetical protein